MSYERLGSQELASLSEKAKIDLSRAKAFEDAFGSASKGPTTGQSSLMSMSDEKAPKNERLDVTHFVGNQQKFHVPEMHPEPKLDVGKPTDRPEEPTKIEQKNESVKADYLEANQQICNQMLEHIDAVPDGGKELGAAIRQAMPQAGGGNSALQMASVGADIAAGGAAGSVYATINAIYADNKNKSGIVGQEAGRILQTAFDSLHKANEAQAEAYRKNPASVKPPLDLSSLKTPQQMLDFLIRDVSKDPVMQKVLNNEKNIEARKENIQNYDDHYTDTPTPEKIAFEIERGRLDIAQEMLKGQGLNVELAKVGDVRGAMEGQATTVTSAEILEARMRMADVGGTKPQKDDISEISATAKEIVAALKIPDPKISPTLRDDMKLTVG